MAQQQSEHARRMRGELKSTIRGFLESRSGQPATITEIRSAAEAKLGPVPQSSVRSGLQDERYFERVERGVFRLRAQA